MCTIANALAYGPSLPREMNPALGLRAVRLALRERDVFRLIVIGTLNKQVAFQFGISEKTIKIHRAHVMEKMGSRSFAELVRMAEKLRSGPEPVMELADIPPAALQTESAY